VSYQVKAATGMVPHKDQPHSTPSVKVRKPTHIQSKWSSEKRLSSTKSKKRWIKLRKKVKLLKFSLAKTASFMMPKK
jgi:hypothetical protein